MEVRLGTAGQVAWESSAKDRQHMNHARSHFTSPHCMPDPSQVFGLPMLSRGIRPHMQHTFQAGPARVYAIYHRSSKTTDPLPCPCSCSSHRHQPSTLIGRRPVHPSSERGCQVHLTDSPTTSAAAAAGRSGRLGRSGFRWDSRLRFRFRGRWWAFIANDGIRA